MKRFFFYAIVSILTASIGIALTIWLTSRRQLRPPVLADVPIKNQSCKDDAIEIVFRDLMQRYPPHAVYFLSFAEADPSDEFMARFKTDPRIKKLSQAIRNANQVVDRDSGQIGVHVQAADYYAINENEVRVGAAWEIVERLGKDPSWTIWCMEYRLQRVSGRWVIESSKILPPLS
jgi:hypothetical protein